MIIFISTQSYAMALGKTKLIFYRELFYFLLRTPIFIWATLTYGLQGAIYSAAALSIAHVGLSLALYQQLSGRPFWEPFWRIRRSLAGCGAMAIYFLILHPMAPVIESAPILLRFLTDVSVGAALYVGVHLLLWAAAGRPDGFERTALALVNGLRSRFPKAAS